MTATLCHAGEPPTTPVAAGAAGAGAAPSQFPHCFPTRRTTVAGNNAAVPRVPRRPVRAAALAVPVALTLAAGLAACSSGPPVAAPRPAPTTGPTVAVTTGTAPPAPAYGQAPLQLVTPATTSSRIGPPADPEVYATPPGASNGLLLVFLPGTGGQPSGYRQFLEVAALAGFHVVGVSYPNTPSVDDLCKNDLSCYGPIRQNLFDGRSTVGLPTKGISPDDAIGFRLGALIHWLTAHDPAGGWGQFLSAGKLDWGAMVFAGHSQGAGESAYIGKVHTLAGVVMLSGVLDASNAPGHQPADWVAEPGDTPLDRYTGFADTADPSYQKILADWSALGLDGLGAPAAVTGPGGDFGGTHELVTGDVPPGPHSVPHGATAANGQTPLCAGGVPVYAAAWTYLLDTAAGRPYTAPGPGDTC